MLFLFIMLFLFKTKMVDNVLLTFDNSSVTIFMIEILLVQMKRRENNKKY